MDKRASLAYKDSLLYKKLLVVAKDGLHAGEKTKEDVATLENSGEISNLNAAIYDIEKQEAFLSLYAKMRDEI